MESIRIEEYFSGVDCQKGRGREKGLECTECACGWLQLRLARIDERWLTGFRGLCNKEASFVDDRLCSKSVWCFVDSLLRETK